MILSLGYYILYVLIEHGGYYYVWYPIGVSLVVLLIASIISERNWYAEQAFIYTSENQNKAQALNHHTKTFTPHNWGDLVVG